MNDYKELVFNLMFLAKYCHSEYNDLCVDDELKKAADAIEQLAKERDTEPVRHGHWISVPHKSARVCSVCEHDEPYKNAPDDADVFNYCPHCGAKMDEKAVSK